MYDFVDFEVYFGGAFNDSGEKCYKGGDVTLFQSLNAGALNFSKVKEMLVGCCNRPVSKFYFHVPNTSLDEGLRLLCPETFPVMIEMALESKEVMEIYIQHVELESESESDSEFDAYVASLDNNSEEGDGDDDNNDDDDDDDDDDDAASLDHMSEDDDDEELISARVRLQEEEIKKTEKMRVQNDDLSCSKGKKKLTDCGNISGDIGDYAKKGLSLRGSKKGDKKKKGKMVVQAEAQEEPGVAPVEAQEIEPKLPKKKKRRKLKFVPYWLK
ncbi:hypothetical protein CASFOL_032918 [Castilleja foliolosa]|uniref:PB1-like domain-containing protein n=1 Tax=Castilleja foliolosa TaxID=1961234 RepID=A0ABD3C3H3_9LAMI